MREILLTQNKVTLIDDEDFEYLNRYKWSANKVNRYWYVTARIQKSDGTKKNERMHRLIMNAPTGMLVDHINGDSLDNRKENLRICKTSTNLQNQYVIRGSSRFQGVYWKEKQKKWAANIGKDGKHYYLGIYNFEEDAARAYNQAALLLYQNPKLNQMEKNQCSKSFVQIVKRISEKRTVERVLPMVYVPNAI